MSREFREEPRKIVQKVVEAIQTMRGEGPEPRYALVEERRLQNMFLVVRDIAKRTNMGTIRDELDGVVDGIRTVLDEANYLNLEEKSWRRRDLSRKSLCRNEMASSCPPGLGPLC